VLAVEVQREVTVNPMKNLICFGKNLAKASLWMGAIALLAVAFPLAASAALGGDAFSVQGDQIRLRASVKTTKADAYTVQEMTAPTGTVVREYVSPAGKVFAVAWRGPFLPDLHQILGASFESFTQAAHAQKGRRPGHGPVVVKQAGLVVVSAGHQRDFFGKAYLTDLLPQGVSTGEIR
jgi:hypothetical protein